MPLQGRQDDDSLHGQLEQEAAGGEIFQTATGIAPVPAKTEFASEAFAAVEGMGSDAVTEPGEVVGVDRASLKEEQLILHGAGFARSGDGSSAQSPTTSRCTRSQLETDKRQLTKVAQKISIEEAQREFAQAQDNLNGKITKWGKLSGATIVLLFHLAIGLHAIGVPPAADWWDARLADKEKRGQPRRASLQLQSRTCISFSRGVLACERSALSRQ